MRVGLFGGSFDPIHSGHITPVKEARDALALERVVYLPTAEPPHKPGRQFAPPHARLTMVELALLDEPGLEVSAFELTPQRPAFTIDSLLHFRGLYAGADLFLIIGEDSFAELHTWRNWQQIVDLAEIVVLERPESSRRLKGGDPPAEIAHLGQSDRVHFLGNTPVEVSATELRQLLARDEELPQSSIPPLVLKYIRKYALYR